ncbi:hypothetical protein ACFY20_45815 [Streptomyces sp. NPDC001312]|uniref:hypothetical protein n=1 Tax=Streptomyces sp. NPDC001312 TaxID=3364561 RepID=UPI0036979875
MAGDRRHRQPEEDAEYVVTDLVTEWGMRGTGEQHVRVIVWEGEEGVDPEDAAFTVEIQPEIDGECPPTAD